MSHQPPPPTLLVSYYRTPVRSVQNGKWGERRAVVCCCRPPSVLFMCSRVSQKPNLTSDTPAGQTKWFFYRDAHATHILFGPQITWMALGVSCPVRCLVLCTELPVVCAASLIDYVPPRALVVFVCVCLCTDPCRPPAPYLIINLETHILSPNLFSLPYLNLLSLVCDILTFTQHFRTGLRLLILL